MDTDSCPARDGLYDEHFWVELPDDIEVCQKCGEARKWVDGLYGMYIALTEEEEEYVYEEGDFDEG